MSPNEQPSRRLTRPLPADNQARVSATGAPAAKPARKLWAWIALPALLACLLAALTMTMIAPTTGQTMGQVQLPSSTATAPALAVVFTPVVPPSATTAENTPVPPTSTAMLIEPTLVAPTLVAPSDTATSAPPTDTPTPAPPADTATPAPTDTPVPPTAIPLPANMVPGDGQALDPVTGLAVEATRLQRKAAVIMIDNHPDAAPQTGLNRADMVIESLAEGGITRFETFFLSGEAGTVGPVRSARPYFVEWAYPFQPFFVHCGGSWEAVDLIDEANELFNVDCFDGSMPFWRSTDRVAPHNLYTSTADLWKLAADKGLAPAPTWPSFPHSAPADPDQRASDASISFDFTKLSRSDVKWVFDRDNDTYLRQQWGDWHVDAVTGETISASNVVILWTNVWALPDDTEGRLGTDTVGTNTALIMRDGKFEWGTWKRDDVKAPLQLFDGNGQPASLVPGRTWIEVLSIGKQVTTTGGQ